MMDDDDNHPGEASFRPDRPWDPEVGYGRPPKATQFKPGQSGNPMGRPRGARTRRFASGGYLLHDALLAEAERPVVVHEGDREIVMTQLQAALRRLHILAMRGDTKAMGLVLKYVEQMQRANRRLNERYMNEVLKYKVAAEAEVRRRHAKGITDTSDILPHPDHIDVDFATGEVLITGPMSASEQAAIEAGHEALQSQRQALAMVDKLAIEELPADMREPVAALRREIKARIMEYSEALGEPYP